MESPPAKRLRLSEEGRGLGEATEGAMVSTEGGIAQEHEVVRSTEGGLPEETGGIPFVGNAEVLRCETRANPVGQAAAKVDESARKKRAAAWLEDLGLEARTPTRDTWQIEKASTELQRHRPLQRVVNKDEAKSGDLASNLLAGTDFEGFGELATSVGKSRGKKRMKGRKL